MLIRSANGQGLKPIHDSAYFVGRGDLVRGPPGNLLMFPTPQVPSAIVKQPGAGAGITPEASLCPLTDW